VQNVAAQARIPIAIGMRQRGYDSSGTYLVTLIITDSLGYKDTLNQYIYKPNCEYENTRQSLIDENEIIADLYGTNDQSLNLIIRPNPFNNFIYLNEKNGHQFNYTIFDLHGKAILNSLAKANSFDICLSEFATGMYIVKIDLDSKINYYKIIKTP
jgi:ribosomal protein L25 (general stress protein Ctc)